MRFSFSLFAITVALVSFCSLVNGQTCPNGLTVYIDPVQNTAVACQVGGACPTGATCLNQPSNSLVLQNLCCRNLPGVTTCTTGQILIGGACFATALPGQPCQVISQCTGGSSCVASTCQCPLGQVIVQAACTIATSTTCLTGQVLVNGQCLNTALPGQTCQVQGQCTGASICTANVCQCPVGQAVVANVCTISTVTVCSTGQVLVNGVCLNQVSPGQTCSDPSQCIGGLLCTNLVCSCPVGTTLSNGICITNVVTTSPIVTCTATQVLVGGVCYNNVGPGSVCTVTQQCQFSSTCVSGICTCPAGQANLGGTCAVPGVTTVTVIGATTVGTVGIGGTDCPQGSVLIYPQTGTPVVCGLIGQPAGSCPSTYPTCMYSARLAQTVCCSASTTNIGTGSVIATVAPTVITATTGVTSATDCAVTNVLMYPVVNQPVVCGARGSPAGSCPSTYPNCVASARYGYSVCCSTTTG